MTNKVEDQLDNKAAQSDEVTNNSSSSDNISLEEALERIKHLEGINKEVIESRDKVKSKLKTFEDDQIKKQEELLQEQGKYKELYEAQIARTNELQESLQTQYVDRELDSSLNEIGLAPEAIKTAKSLINKSSIRFSDDNKVDKSSVADAIEQLKQEHSVLFNIKRQTPDIKRPNVDTDQTTYEAELKRIRANPRNPNARRELDALRAKYGKD